MTDEINWGFNCLTGGVHHGRPEALWNLPLSQALMMYQLEGLKEIVVARIYNDAMQYVDHSPFTQKETGAKAKITQKWADSVRTLAGENFTIMFATKLDEIVKYYSSPSWESDVEDVIERIKEDKLNPGYKPLHTHDSINMLCRIIGVDCSISSG